MSGRPVSIVDVYPGVFFPQGDGGNIRTLGHRARRRGYRVTELRVLVGDPLPVGDIYVIGGSEDEDQPAIAERLRRDGALARAVAGGAVVFAVGAGYQILGHTLEVADGGAVEGVGLIDATTTLAGLADRRVVTLPAPELGLPAMSGYESHRGRTTLGPGARPLAGLEIGTGNGGVPPTDGAVQGRVVGTYLHGPVLPRNPELADLILSWAIGEPLEPLPSVFAEAVRRERIAEAHEYARRAGGH